MVFNVTETMVKDLFTQGFLEHRKLVCNCARCQDDILAMALNHLPARYVSSDKGEVFVKAQSFNPQLQSDVLRELELAAEKVGQRPRHS
ncbi:MAG: hypothetical protein A2201_06090 [Alicyclobacillus sp. RIFOXYA1_FULL_53_8]|nr:MAG: hypothetical protein A2201_06090 [Alicyclobacillus sp. RIFOXYA1_FULL_53_8]